MEACRKGADLWNAWMNENGSVCVRIRRAYRYLHTLLSTLKSARELEKKKGRTDELPKR